VEWYQVAFGEIYPLVYPHRDIAEAARVASKLAPLVAAKKPTLDVACGNGRYMCALAGAGVDVYGVDLSEFLLGEAAGQGLAGRVVCGDMRELPFRTGVFGSAINMFTSFGYFERDADNARALHEIARVVTEEGTFVMDFINAERARRTMKPASRRTEGDAEIEERRSLSADGRVLSKQVQVHWPGRDDVSYTERVRLYARAELEEMLGEAGFEIRSVHGNYDLDVFDIAVSDRLILNCKRQTVVL